MRRTSRSLLIGALCLLAWPLMAQDEIGEEEGGRKARREAAREAAREEFLRDRTPESCVSLNRVRRTRIIDDRTILFFLRGGDVYQNILPRTCPGLKNNDRFTYTPFSGRLCDTDTIVVLEQFGRRFNPGFTCRLGSYYPISPVQAQDLVLASDERAPGGGSPVEVTEVELPPDYEDEDAEAENTESENASLEGAED